MSYNGRSQKTILQPDDLLRSLAGRNVKDMKIVFLDDNSIGTDIDLSGFESLGEVVRYGSSKPEEVPERVKDADVVIINKMEINERTIGTAEKLLLFYLLEKMPYYDNYVKSEKYVNDAMFTHFANHFHELCGMTWGIIGLGAIGRRVADLAKAFGCHVIYYSTSGNHTEDGYERVDFDTLLKTSDIVSVHAPLTEQTEQLMNAAAFSKMKNSAIFINVGRGPIVVEADLADALEQGEIAAAGLDVLSAEPMRCIKDSEKLVITPHIAWAAVETRKRLMDIILQQVKELFEVKQK